MGVSIAIKSKAIFFDRDGVINKAIVINGKPYPPKSLSEIVLLNGVKEGMLMLRQYGYKLFIVTNQPDVGRGLIPVESIIEIHSFLLKELEIDEIFCCFHGSDNECDCRKPKPGMILKAIEKWNICKEGSFLIGDRWRDIEAGKSAGIKTILIDYHYEEKKSLPFITFDNTFQAMQFILKQNIFYE